MAHDLLDRIFEVAGDGVRGERVVSCLVRPPCLDEGPGLALQLYARGFADRSWVQGRSRQKTSDGMGVEIAGIRERVKPLHEVCEDEPRPGTAGSFERFSRSRAKMRRRGKRRKS
jgi:hypothetical protein